ncbi:lytic transglycosylase domain-containing protein [Cellulomonas edaphi]|uniref:LysM peptidoglycan-binding domain-containing protein n=1 Tax=Cellulomonas edaphi TaxID=3053468 RepID=A0ABT7S702_9CELL|nr:lytic transglycosylase domain-containing protein [Cellulomons edaphi]MDM7831398.1 LysM peptidoglycan-binding domain-containing protein [Cellulomons edaphi]
MTQPTATRPDVRKLATTSTGAIALAAIAVGVSATAADANERYTVRAGDTVSHIALRTGTTVASIARANSLADASRIHVGQVLSIPTSGPTASTTHAKPAKPRVTHTVRAGDTVSAIAHRYGTTVASVVAKNHLDARAMIRVGQVLTISGGSKATVAPSRSTHATPAKVRYTVRSGDTVGAIAAKHGISVAAIVKANGLGANALIRIGQVLTLPGSTSTKSATPSGGKVPSTFAGRTYSQAVVGAANANKATLERIGVPSKAEMQRKVVSTARKMGLDPALAQAIAYQESGFNHTAVSPANAIGVMQVIPSSGEWASDLVGRHLNLLDPQDNVTAGVAILRSLVRTSPDLPRAIAGYYQGASSVRKYGMFADTRRYVANVQTLMTRFG